MIIAFRMLRYANALTPDEPWPSSSFKTCLVCGLWVLFPFVSGFVSRVCEPHHRLIAVFEGASAPALFLVMSEHFPL